MIPADDAAVPVTDGAGERRRFLSIVLGGWALTAIALIAIGAKAIAARTYGDPDNVMRLLQVRDWLAGQGWFDVAQHRLGDGNYPMHWSRLVDLPLAGTIVLLRPLLGAVTAETVAIVLVPLLTYLIVFFLLAGITRRLAGAATVPFAIVLAALSPPLQFQLQPLRIDHHGWQVALALAAVLPLLGAPTRRNGAWAGLALATLLTVSLEGLPIAVAITALAALAWAWRPERGRMLVALLWTLFGAAAALQALTRGPLAFAPACDAMAPAWIAVLGFAAIGVSMAVRFARHGVVVRLGALAVAGALAGAVLLATTPQCVAGPFATLPPRVYRLWYLHVQEGRPIWEQGAAVVLTMISVPVAGVVGTLLGWRDARGDLRERWAMLGALAIVAGIVSVLVIRASATANALAVPGAAVLLRHLLLRARALRSAAPRILATLGALAFVSPAHVALVLLVLLKGAPEDDTPLPGACTASDMRQLAMLPPGIVFAPLDVTPELLVGSGHRAIAGGYHRGAIWIDRVIVGFTAPPEQARAAIARSNADYVTICPGLPEAQEYARVAPGGLMARLSRGEGVAWLRPIALPGRAKAWRVIRPAAAPTG